MSSAGPRGSGADGDPARAEIDEDADARTEVRKPLGPADDASRSTLPPKRAIPSHVLEHARVVQGARRSDPSSRPPPPRPVAIPPPPSPLLANELAPRAIESIDDAEHAPIGTDSVEVPLDAEPTPPPTSGARPTSQGRGSLQMPAICTYGRFDILGRVAFGGMAEIFLGRETTSVGATRLLAIKRILAHVADDPRFVAMFLDEARLAIQLTHPQICHIYEFGELEGTYFIAMEWIHGAQLGKLIRKARGRGGIAPELGARIVAYVAEALHYAHRARDANGEPLGIVHRDVSPHNVMVSFDGQVKLLDFGIAKAQSHTTKTQAGVVKGKFSYMSPQQCLGKPIDARADVFALGICLYETLTGEPLYHRATEYETMRAVIEDPVPSIRTVNAALPAELDAIVQKALQKEPRDRFATAGEMQAALEDWLAKIGKAVTTARIASLMEPLFEEQIHAGPLVDSTPFGESFRKRPSPIAQRVSPPQAGARVEGTPMPATIDEPSATRSRTAWIASAAAAAVLALIGAGWIASSATSSHPAVTSAPAAVVAPPEEVVPTIAAPPAATSGHLVLRGAPPDAIVRIGDRTLRADELAAPIELPAGAHLVHAERPDHRSYDVGIDVRAGESIEVELAWAPLPRAAAEARGPVARPGHLSINTRPWSKVYVGSRLLGTTPIGEANVPSGTVRLRIVDRDGRTFSRTVRVQPGGDESVFYDLDE
ncbi:serine/threonine-protein kinase [Sandaracinus amylolyticus]|uniref:Serine/threonine protein kinase n=1 Tax=Sandaracinus amylolyticus TaxID=927083 RepID=A0A0F6W8R5_9BACT|nr:serine/threonine-protein kinase [Sandaracinus amylolyticus]AKF10280.1 serine/threonine protein kinase [Sandaracinus amylolyticus]